MPIWLATFLTQLIAPIVQDLIKQMGIEIKLAGLSSDLKDVKSKLSETQDGVVKMAQAKTDQERDDALEKLAHARNGS